MALSSKSLATVLWLYLMTRFLVLSRHWMRCGPRSKCAAELVCSLRNGRRKAIGLVSVLALRVTLGLIGSDERSQYAAIGSVTNLASRLCDTAEDGQILVDSKLHASIAQLVQVQELGEVTPKGFRRPVRVVNVIHLRGATME
jgi:class 3 adenylate cyclase